MQQIRTAQHEQQPEWVAFPTVKGVCGISWRARAVTGFALPEATAATVERALQRDTGNRSPAAKVPAWVQKLIRHVQAHLQGKQQDFSAVPVQVAGATDFMQAVYRAAQALPAGSVVTYAELAARMGKPNAVRAVGTALGKNPIPLIIPCHRIIAANGKPGGFSAGGGVHSKLALLACEGVSLEKPRTLATAAQWQQALTHLRRDKCMAGLMKKVGDIDFRPHHNAEPMQALIAAIVSQQLSTKVASTIHKRVKVLIEKNGKPCAKKMLATPDADLRAAGLSFMKIAYLKDVAQHSLDGKLPALADVKKMSDEQIIQQLTAIKGVGRWTVEMYLMFDLGRADVFPVDDYGIRKAIMRLHHLPEMPPAKQLMPYGENWKPFRTVASLYLWRSLDKT